MSNDLSAGIVDLGRGFALRRVWVALAVEDVSDAHRRTTLGPAWILLNYLLMVGTFVLIFGHVMGIENYVAFVAIGLLLWNYIADALGQGTTLFVREEAMIKGTVLPLSTYVFKQMVQLLIRFAYALVGCVGILLLAGVRPSMGWLEALLGLALLVVATPPMIVIMGLLGARFRDLSFVVANLLRIGMFLTPVIWLHSRAPAALSWLSTVNPASYFIEVVRQPMLGGGVPMQSAAILGAFTAALWMIALPLLGRFRSQVVFSL